MYTNLIEEDIMTLDNEFFKINTMFETVDKMYLIKQKELEYNYIYTESINEIYTDLYTEAQNDKNEKEQGLLGRLFTAILNFIRKIRAKLLRLFGNDKKAAELEAKIKGNPKLANQTVEITNTTDAEKAIDEGTSFFGSLIDKIVKGTATEADADAAEEKNKSLLSRIGIFGGGALLVAGGAKVANDKLHITEKLGNLLKREEDTKKKAAKVTQENEQTVQKGDQALKNNSQSGNEENTKAGRRIMGSFKGFITDVGKFFTGKASELKSRFSSSSSSNDEEERDSNHECQLNINLIKKYNEDGRELTEDEQKQVNKIKDKIKNKKCTENDVEILNKIIDTVSHRSKSDTQKNKKNETEEHQEQKEETPKEKPSEGESQQQDDIQTNTGTQNKKTMKIKGGKFTGKSKTAKKSEHKVKKQSETSTTDNKQPTPPNEDEQEGQTKNKTDITEQKNLTPEEQKEFDKYKEENETLKQEISGYINNKNNIKIAYFKQQKFYATEKDYNIKLKGQRHPEIKPSMTLEKIKEYNQKFKNHRDEIKESYEMRMKISEDENKEKTPNKVEKQPETKSDKPEETESKTKPEDKVEKQPEDKVEKQPETKSDKPEETESKTKPEDKVEKQPENKTDTTEQKKDNEVKSDITDVLSSSIRNIIKLLKVTSNIDKNHPPKNVNVYGMKRGKREVYYLLDEAHTYLALFDRSKESEKEYLKRIIEYADYLNKIRNNINFDELAEYTNDDDKYGLMEDFNEQYSVINNYLDDAKKNLKEIEEYERQQKSSKTTNESSYDLINDILTIFENSF